MNNQRRNPQVRILDAIDQDLMDGKISLNLIEKLTQQNAQPSTGAFNNEELQILIRNCTHAVILNLTKTLEKPKEKTKVSPKKETYNLESLIDSVCHDEDKDTLKKECHKIRGNKVYCELVKYRNKIIAHRNIEYRTYHAIAQEFAECTDYLLKKKESIEKLLQKINDLQMNIKSSRIKKLGFPDNGAEIFMIDVAPEDVGKEQTIRFAYSTKYES
ncbi:MAG: hypothetical protein OXC79_10800 [Candidatus Poribacteria bacterium]|nr:hypothetical protein [Candidatus Poribacteria bacterium]